jgi:Uma2 family endonuclease
MVFTQPKKALSFDEYLDLDFYDNWDGIRYEFIDGEIIMAPPPAVRHQEVLGKLYFLIQIFLQQRSIGKIYIAPFAVHLRQQNKSFEPDLVFIKNENLHLIKPEGKDAGIHGVPDLVIEVLSPYNVKYDVEIKYRFYEQYGIPEYWIADPMGKQFDFYVLDEGKYKAITPVNGIFRSKVLEGFELNVETFWQGW